MYYFFVVARRDQTLDVGSIWGTTCSIDCPYLWTMRPFQVKVHAMLPLPFRNKHTLSLSKIIRKV